MVEPSIWEAAFLAFIPCLVCVNQSNRNLWLSVLFISPAASTASNPRYGAHTMRVQYRMLWARFPLLTRYKYVRTYVRTVRTCDVDVSRTIGNHEGFPRLQEKKKRNETEHGTVKTKTIGYFR